MGRRPWRRSRAKRGEGEERSDEVRSRLGACHNERSRGFVFLSRLSGGEARERQTVRRVTRRARAYGRHAWSDDGPLYPCEVASEGLAAGGRGRGRQNWECNESRKKLPGV